MRIFTLIVISLLLSAEVFAQTGIIRGVVYDSDKESLPGVNLLIKETKDGTTTNINGQFAFINLKDGTYTFQASYIGFESKETTISIKPGETNEVEIVLVAGILLNEVVINSRLIGQSKSINTQKNAMNITSIISAEELSRFPDANIGDALKV